LSRAAASSPLIIPRPHPSTLFPYTTLFRSAPKGVNEKTLEGYEQDVKQAEEEERRRRQEIEESQRMQNQEESQELEQGTGTMERSEEHTSELQSRENLVCRLLLEKKKQRTN